MKLAKYALCVLMLFASVGCSSSEPSVSLRTYRTFWEMEHSSGKFADSIRWVPQRAARWDLVDADVNDLFLTPLPYVGRRIRTFGSVRLRLENGCKKYGLTPLENQDMDFFDTLDRQAEIPIAFEYYNGNSITNKIIYGDFDITYSAGDAVKEYFGVTMKGWPATGFYMIHAETGEDFDGELSDIPEPLCFYKSEVEEFKLEFVNDAEICESKVHYYSGILKVICYDKESKKYSYRVGSIWNEEECDGVELFLRQLYLSLNDESLVTKVKGDGFAQAHAFTRIPVKKFFVWKDSAKASRLHKLIKQYAVCERVED